jgi:hypothetical protein
VSVVCRAELFASFLPMSRQRVACKQGKASDSCDQGGGHSGSCRRAAAASAFARALPVAWTSMLWVFLCACHQDVWEGLLFSVGLLRGVEEVRPSDDA